MQIFIKTFTGILLFSTTILLTGCWDRREVNDTAIVLGTAIDKSHNNSIKLTVQVLVPRSVSGGQQGSGGGANAQLMVRSATGENMADALSKLQTKIPRNLFLGHCKTYIIGEKLARDGGFQKQIDFLLRHPEPRERSYLYVSYGEAAHVLKFRPILEQYMGEGLRKLTEMHIGITTTIKDFEQMITGDAEAAVLPLIKFSSLKFKKGEESFSAVSGTAIFKKGKMVGTISPKITRGLLWLRNEIEVTAVTVNPKKGETISLDPVREKTKIIPTIRNGKWEITININSEGAIVQNGSNLDITEPAITKKVEKFLEKDIEDRINQAIKRIKNDMNIDVFGFAEAFHRKYPKEWQKVSDHWDQILPQTDVKVIINTNIRRPGLTTIPAGLKEKEVEKK